MRIALLYGSAARGGLTSRSDIDVLVVGEASFVDVVANIGPLQNTLHREINPTVLTLAELEARIAQKDHFISNVLGSYYIVVLGDRRELDRLVEKRLAD